MTGHAENKASSPFLQRVVLIAIALAYGYALHYAHAEYLYPEWHSYRFTFVRPDAIATLATVGLVVLGAIAMPVRLQRPSSVVLLMLFIVVYVPTVVLTFSLSEDALSRYGATVGMLGVAFVLPCIASRLPLPYDRSTEQLPDVAFERAAFLIWAAFMVVLLVRFGDVMRFVGLDEIYDQRGIGTAVSGGAMAYVQTYVASVLSPALIALGLVKRRVLLILAGTAGCLVMYLITAQRFVFLLPIVIVALFFMLRSKRSGLGTVAFSVGIFSGLTVLAVAFHQVSGAASFMSLYLVFRTIGLPGLSFSLYQDLFAQDGLTWWSHVRGISSFVQPPVQFGDHPSWPALGHLVGDYLYNDPIVNFNANLYSGDGVAAAGALGVLVAGLCLALYLRLLDLAASGWDRTFTILVILPVGLGIANGHLSTALLSFGGLLWLAVFYLYKPSGAEVRTHRPVPAQALGAQRP